MRDQRFRVKITVYTLSPRPNGEDVATYLDEQECELSINRAEAVHMLSTGTPNSCTRQLLESAARGFLQRIAESIWARTFKSLYKHIGEI
jgi:hypothetical protein